MKRSQEPSRLLRPHGHRANLQRQSKAQVVLVAASQTVPQADSETTPSQSSTSTASRWRRRRNTY